MSRVLYRIGHFAGRHPWRVVAGWIALAAAVFMLNGSVGGAFDESFTVPGAESQRAADAIEDRYPQETLYTSNIIFHSDEGLTKPEFKKAIEQTVTELAQGEHVIDVASPYDPRGPTLSEDGETAFATVAYDTQKIELAEFEEADKATEAARDAGVQVEYDGGLGYAKGDAEPGSEKIGILVAIVVLAIAFGSLVAMSLPILVALISVGMGTMAIGVLAGQFAVPEIASIVGLMLGLGVGIDYALFILARHRQNLDAGMPVPVAIGRANATAGLSVLFAGGTVMVAIGGLKLSGIPMMAMMGWASAIMVAITMFAAVTLLPALLGIVGRKVNSARIPFIKQKPAYDEKSWSTRWAKKVVRRPVLYGAFAALVLTILAIPVFSMRLGFADAGNDGPSTTTRKAYDLIAEGYGEGVNGPFMVVVDDKGADNPEQVVTDVSEALANTKGVASVDAPTVNEAGDLAIVTLTPTTAPQDEETSQLLERLREDIIPTAVGDSKVEVSVTGSTPMTEDVSTRLQERMPYFLAAVIGMSFIILTFVFRSVLVPLKAAVLNVLGVGAAYGVVVAMFQWGWGASLIGVHETVPIMPLAPMLMFAILFGLSMDYEVFLLSRVREQYLRHGNPVKAVVESIGSTARVITSAGLIMIAVFGSFILMNDVTTKMFGVGLAVAVLLDVTLVRMVLVPAAMALMGHRAWWLPAWLDRLLPTIDLEGSEHEEQIESDSDTDSDEEKDLVLV